MAPGQRIQKFFHVSSMFSEIILRNGFCLSLIAAAELFKVAITKNEYFGRMEKSFFLNGLHCRSMNSLAHIEDSSASPITDSLSLNSRCMSSWRCCSLYYISSLCGTGPEVSRIVWPQMAIFFMIRSFKNTQDELFGYIGDYIKTVCYHTSHMRLCVT